MTDCVSALHQSWRHRHPVPGDACLTTTMKTDFKAGTDLSSLPCERGHAESIPAALAQQGVVCNGE